MLPLLADAAEKSPACGSTSEYTCSRRGTSEDTAAARWGREEAFGASEDAAAAARCGRKDASAECSHWLCGRTRDTAAARRSRKEASAGCNHRFCGASQDACSEGDAGRYDRQGLGQLVGRLRLVVPLDREVLARPQVELLVKVVERCTAGCHFRLVLDKVQLEEIALV